MGRPFAAVGGGLAPGVCRAIGGTGRPAGPEPFHRSGFEGVTTAGLNPACKAGPRCGAGPVVGTGGCWRGGSVSITISSGLPVSGTPKSASSKRSPGFCQPCVGLALV